MTSPLSEFDRGFDEGLRAIANILNDSKDWNADTFDEIVQLLTARGIDIKEYDDTGS